jgi:hypothetical protein
MATKEQLKGSIIVGYMEHIAPALERVLQRFGELSPDDPNPPKFQKDFHDLVNRKLEGWLKDHPDEQPFIATTLNEYLRYQVASYLHANPKAAAAVEKAKNLTAPEQPASEQLVPEPPASEQLVSEQQPAVATAQMPAASFAPAAAAAIPVAAPAAKAGNDKGKGVKALQNVIKTGGTLLSSIFAFKPPKIVTDVSNLTEFALGVIFGTAKGIIQQLREESKLAQNLQNIKHEVTTGYIADVAPKLSKALEHYDEILSTPGDHPLLAELNREVTGKMQQWANGKTADERRFITQTFSTLLQNQTSAMLVSNPALARRVGEDRALLEAFGIPAAAIHPSIAAQEWTPEHALNAVKEDGSNLKFVPEQLVTEDLCSLAVAGENGKGEALEHVPERFKAPILCETAMLKNPAQAFAHVPDGAKTPKLCDMAVSADGANLQRVPQDKMSRALCEAAVKSFGKSFAYVPQDMRDAALCLTAVKVDGTNLQHVPDSLKTKRLCTEAQKSTAQDVQPFFPKKFAVAPRANPSKRLQAALAEGGSSMGVSPKAALAQQAPPLKAYSLPPLKTCSLPLPPPPKKRSRQKACRQPLRR